MWSKIFKSSKSKENRNKKHKLSNVIKSLSLSGSSNNNNTEKCDKTNDDCAVVDGKDLIRHNNSTVSGI